MHELVLDQAERTPEAIAITAGDEDFSYARLVAAARRVAVDLVASGAAGQMVGIAAERDAATVAAMVGVLLAGCAYVPFASDLPAPRRALIFETAGLTHVVGTERSLVGIPRGTRRHRVDLSEEGAGSDASGLPPVSPDHLAYVSFTSGSTGEPKGVVVGHRQLVHSTLARFQVFPLPAVGYLMLAPFTFNAAAAGTYFALCSGGRMIVPTTEEVLDPGALAALIERTKPSHFDSVPSQYAAFLRFRPDCAASLGCCVLAGEPLASALVDLHFEAAPSTPLFNEYGPTEATIWSTVHRCDPGEEAALAPIGKARPGARIYLLGDEMRPVPSGATGEVVVGGDGVANGYLGRPELTAERFVPDCFATEPDARMYLTGDLASERADGVLEYKGRVDRQVKIRGHRVEPAEVEATLAASPLVLDCAVTPFRTLTGPRLVAHVLSVPGEADVEAALSTFLRERLPDYMIPASWISLEQAVPLTPNGKVDRRRLPTSEVSWEPILNRSDKDEES